MKKILSVLLLLVFLAPVCHAVQNTRVLGYRKSNGTYVRSYNRSKADYTKRNNYSTKGNYNPYTGKKGSVNPYKTKGYRY